MIGSVRYLHEIMTTCPTVYNALLRCTRKDRLAHPLFECERDDLNLWVWELGSFSNPEFKHWVAQIEEMIRQNLALLSKLERGSTDYTLHLVVEFAGPCFPIVFPPSFLELVRTAGFALEIYPADE